MASDLFDFDGGQYIVWLTCTQRCGLCKKRPSAGATSAAIISNMKEMFAEHGVPDILKSDSGPQYASAAFTEFTKKWGFQHTVTSPHYPASYGFAESMVKIKTAFKKAKYSGEHPQPTLLALCSTPVDSHLPSQVQLLYQWKLKTRLSRTLSSTNPQADEYHEHFEDKASHAKIDP